MGVEKRNGIYHNWCDEERERVQEEAVNDDSFIEMRWKGKGSPGAVWLSRPIRNSNHALGFSESLETSQYSNVKM